MFLVLCTHHKILRSLLYWLPVLKYVECLAFENRITVNQTCWNSIYSSVESLIIVWRFKSHPFHSIHWFLEVLEKLSQFATVDKTVITEESANTHDNEMNQGILQFEFPINYKELQNHMALLFRKSGSGGKVWINGKMDIKTR